MSRTSVKIFLPLWILLSQNENISASSCLASIPTLQPVEFCPKTQQEWNEKSARKRCETLAGTSRCSSFVYHCLLNKWRNVTFEVCAPTWYMSGFCAMYDTEEFRVVDNFNFDCHNTTKIKKEDRCPPRYISSDTYKYQICYSKQLQKDINPETDKQSSMDDGHGTSVLTIVFIVLFVLAVITSVFLAALLYRIGWDKIWKRDTSSEIKNQRSESNQKNSTIDTSSEMNQCSNSKQKKPTKDTSSKTKNVYSESEQKKQPKGRKDTKPNEKEADCNVKTSLLTDMPEESSRDDKGHIPPERKQELEDIEKSGHVSQSTFLGNKEKGASQCSERNEFNMDSNTHACKETSILEEEKKKENGVEDEVKDVFGDDNDEPNAKPNPEISQAQLTEDRNEPTKDIQEND